MKWLFYHHFHFSISRQCTHFSFFRISGKVQRSSIPTSIYLNLQEKNSENSTILITFRSTPMLGRRGGLLDGGLDNAQKLGQGSGCSDQFAGASNMPASLADTLYSFFRISGTCQKSSNVLCFKS